MKIKVGDKIKIDKKNVVIIYLYGIMNKYILSLKLKKMVNYLH